MKEEKKVKTNDKVSSKRRNHRKHNQTFHNTKLTQTKPTPLQPKRNKSPTIAFVLDNANGEKVWRCKKEWIEKMYVANNGNAKCKSRSFT